MERAKQPVLRESDLSKFLCHEDLPEACSYWGGCEGIFVCPVMVRIVRVY